MKTIKRLSRKRQEQNVEWAQQWLQRAKQDYSIFKKLVAFDKKTHNTVRCSDPALAVYLLQQSIEKTMKAIAIASGQYSYRQISHTYGHNSLALYADLYLILLQAIQSKGLSQLLVLQGFNIEEQEKKLNDLKEKALKQKPDLGEVLYFDQFKSLPSNEIDKVLDLLDSIRNNVILKTLKNVWGPHSKIKINLDDIKIDTTQDFISSAFKAVSSQINLPSSEQSMQFVSTFIDILQKQGINLREAKGKAPEKVITVDKNLDSYFDMSATIYLLELAAITFPHENSCRYPKVPSFIAKQENISTFGVEDYNDSLGIVNRLGRIGYATGLMLSEIKLDGYTNFFNIKPITN